MKKATHETDRSSIQHFEQIINVGSATAEDFRQLGFTKPQDLMGKKPECLYTKLCKISRCRQDPCVLDVFIAAIDFMEGNPPRQWWEYTEERKSKFEHVYAE